MAGYLICVDKESGVPIFARKLGEIEHVSQYCNITLTIQYFVGDQKSESTVGSVGIGFSSYQMEFPVAASLNGVRVFGKSQGVDLISSLTNTSRFLWRDYESSIALIFGGTDDSVSELHLGRMLDNVFYAMALFVGMHNLKKPVNVDKLRRSVRVCYPTIDKILNGLRPTEMTMYFADLTACVDVSFRLANNSKAQSLLDSFTQSLDIAHGVVYSVGTVLASTSRWNDISLTDRIIIGLTVQATQFTDSNIQENVIFLPKTSADVPLRLVAVKCSENIRVCLLCGRNPGPNAIRKEATRILESPPEMSAITTQLSLQALSPNQKLFNAHRHTEGFLVRNLHDRVCAFAIFQESGQQIKQKLELLRVFFRNTVPECLPWTIGGRVASTLSLDKKEEGNDTEAEEKSTLKLNRAKETFWCSDYYKCHAVQFGAYQLFVIYSVVISQTVLRKSTWQLLRTVVKDKAIK